MLHPVYEAAGLFKYTYINEMLIVDNKNEYFEIDNDTCYVKLKKENELILKHDNLDYQFQKYESNQRVDFQKLYFEAEPCDGTCPVFELSIFSDGTVKYNGIEFTKIEGEKSFKLNYDIIEEINDLLEIVKIKDYPDDKFSNPPGHSRFNMVVEYPNGLKISIIDGLFEGKYENIIKYFYFFERQLIEINP